jgi:putative ABC transport system permease protein
MTAWHIAWLQLRKELRRLAAALAGILFAVILMLVQLGFEGALFESCVRLLSHLDGEIVIFSSSFRAMNVPNYFTSRRIYQAAADPDVQSASAVYFDSVMWRNPDSKQLSRIFVVGFDPSDHVLDIDEVNRQMAGTHALGAVLFDRASRPEFGDVARWLGDRGTVVTEVSGLRIDVRGVFTLGTSFLADGTIVTSDENFVRLIPHRQLGLPDVGLLKLRPGADEEQVLARLRSTLPTDVRVAPREDLMRMEQRFWAQNTPIGFVFRLGLLLAMVVGTIIVYQILYTDVTSHLAEYATLKALGHTDGYLLAIVFWQSLILSVLGFLPGVLLSQAVYAIARDATLLPLRLTIANTVLVYALTAVMCCASGALAVRRLRDADPAEIF